MRNFVHFICLFLLLTVGLSRCDKSFTVDLSSRGRMFEGVGSVSGGGAMARMLPEYPEPQRSQILDLLFKPGFGASIQMFKVEIGGDDDTTMGVESSHRHYEWETGNFRRGYEFWFMQEAKKRNPNIKLYGLPWCFPGFLGNGSLFLPYADVNKTADYVAGWVLGAKTVWGYDIDYVGIWNEKPEYVPYIKALYHRLAALNLKTEIVAGDNHWEIVDHMNEDAELAKMIPALSIHYPGGYSPSKALKLDIPLIDSEDDSTDLYDTKTGCVARIIPRNYASGYFTLTYVFNIITAFYDNLDYPRTGMLTANEPWSGWYRVDDPVWMTAHTTQFTDRGWYYLAHGSGVDMLENDSGSYVTLVSPTDESKFTIVIETIEHEKSVCVRPPINAYPKFRSQKFTFSLKNWKLQSLPKLYVRYSNLDSGEIFAEKPAIQLKDDLTFTIDVGPNEVITLSTASPGVKGSFGEPKPRKPFPIPYSDDFESTEIDAEGQYMIQQIGVFEVQDSGDKDHGQVLKQMLLQSPITWCPLPNFRPMVVFGDFNWTSYSFAVDVKLPEENSTQSVYIGARIQQGGCTTFTSSGIFVWVNPSENSVSITERLFSLRKTCAATYEFKDVHSWFNLKISVAKDSMTSVFVNGETVIPKCAMTGPAEKLKTGFLGLGTEDFKFALYDNIKVNQLSTEALNV